MLLHLVLNIFPQTFSPLGLHLLAGAVLLPRLCPESASPESSSVCWQLPPPVHQARPSPHSGTCIPMDAPQMPPTHLFKNECTTLRLVTGSAPTSVPVSALGSG